MFCPVCRAEFRDDVATCPDCDVELLAELPPEPAPDDELVSVLDTADVSLLPVIKSVLSSAGIPFLVQGDEAVGVLPVGKMGVGGFSAGGHGLAATVLVPREHEQEARAVLTQLTDFEGEIEGDLDEPDS